MRRLRCGIALYLAVVGGCAKAWQFDYDQACRQGRRDDRDVFVFYKDPLDTQSSQMRDIIKNPLVAPFLNNKIRCMLVPSYAPNRRFVAQFSIDQPPAMIVVHPDATFHALEGMHSAEEVRAFLASAKMPGHKAAFDRRVPRHAAFEYFNIADRAEETAQRQNRRLMIIYKWWLNADSTELIRRVSRADVAGYFSDTVNCILDWDYPPNRKYVWRYGVSRFPALIMVEPNGRYRTLKGLPSVDQIIRFALAGRPSDRNSAALGSRPVHPPVQWYSDHDAALRYGQRQGRDVLIFYHSVFSDESNALALALAGQELSGLLVSTVNCRLDWSDRANRSRMARFGVEEVPALLLVHPDGTYDVHRSSNTAEQVRLFLDRPTTPTSPLTHPADTP